MIRGILFSVDRVVAVFCFVLVAWCQPCFAAGPAIEGGKIHTLGLKSDGTVFAWGQNNFGQLGNNTTTGNRTPISLGSLSDVASIGCGAYASFAVRQDGTLYAWGHNTYGELGDGSTTNHLEPTLVPGISACKAVSPGEAHTMALMADGTIKAWGYNNLGQLGNGTTTQSLSPVTVPGLTGVEKICAGMNSSFAVKSDGTLWAWGYNNEMQLGDGTNTNRLSPFQVPGITGVTAISHNYRHTLALKSDGTVWGWGDNSDGQLGDGTLVSSGSPKQVPGISGASAIAAGKNCSAALVGGRVWTWGDNSNGQLGNNSTIDSPVPIMVTAMDHVAILSNEYNSVKVMKDDGSVWGWGYNVGGILGNNASSSVTSLPVQTQGAGGEDHLNLLSTDGYSYYLPYYYRYGGNFTSLALRNQTADSGATVSVTAYNQDGSVIGGGGMSQFTLPARGQMASVLPENATPGWVEVLSNQPLAGLCFVGVAESSQGWPYTMADISLLSGLSTKFIIPHVAQDANWDTAVFMCNPQTAAASLTLVFVDAQGNAMYTMNETMAARGSGVYFLEDLIPQGISYSQGSVEITSSQGVTGFAIYYDTVKKNGTCYAGISAVPVE
ncbi:MAG: hypothetical protein V1793_23140 [Pseudomonadota bacterium]